VARQPFYQRIDLVKADHVSGVAVGRDRARSQSDHAHPLRVRPAAQARSQTKAGVKRVVRQRLP
jgi:hypothetical protein